MTNDLQERVAMAVEGMDTSTFEGGRAVAYAAIAEMGGVKVKPLEWIECEDGTLHDTKCRYEIVTDDGYWRVTRGVTGGASYVADCSSLDFAKATAQDDYEDCILAAIEPAPDSVQKPNIDYCYNRKDWEATFGWDDRDILVDNMLPGDVMEVGTLQQGPTLWVVEHENSDGDRETRWFDNEADARALAEGQDND